MNMSSVCHKQVRHRATVSTGILLALVPVTVLAVASCGPVLDPEKPLFRFEIDLPTSAKSTAAELTIQPGTQAVVPLTIVSTRDEPVEVSLSISHSHEEVFAEAITITVPEGYVSVPTGKRITVEIIYDVGETVAPGLYHTNLTGTLSEPIEGLAGIAQAIDIIVTEPLMIPQKYPPAYYIEIQFPPDEHSQESGLFSLKMERGSSITLPVNVASWSDVPIHIRLALSSHPTIPEFVTFKTKQEYVTLEPEECIDITVTFTIAKSATPGSYRMSIRGELEEPVEERATMGQGFTLVID